MKKRLACLLLLTLLLCSCKNVLPIVEEPPDMPKFYEANIHIISKAGLSQAHIKCLSAERIYLSFTHPENIGGLNVICNDNTYHMDMLGIAQNFQREMFLKDSLLILIVETMKALCLDSGFVFEKVGNIWTYSGIVENREFTATQNSETGYIEELNIDGAGLKVSFSDFKLIYS